MSYSEDFTYVLVKNKLDNDSTPIFMEAMHKAQDEGKSRVYAFACGFDALRKNGYENNPITWKWEKKKPETVVTMTKIQKTDEDKRLVFGFFNVIEEKGQTVIDHQGHMILEKDLEEAAYRYVKHYRVGDERHDSRAKAVLVESMMFTKEKQAALGIDLGLVGWWGGFHVTDDKLWAKIKSGEYLSFSIGGVANAVDG